MKSLIILSLTLASTTQAFAGRWSEEAKTTSNEIKAILSDERIQTVMNKFLDSSDTPRAFSGIDLYDGVISENSVHSIFNIYIDSLNSKCVFRAKVSHDISKEKTDDIKYGEYITAKNVITLLTDDLKCTPAIN